MKYFLSFLTLFFALNLSADVRSNPIFQDSGDPLLELSKGNKFRHKVVNKFGKTGNADNGVLTDVWSGASVSPVWVAPTTARLHDIASTSGSDDGAPVGVGARTIRVYGLTSWDAKEISEVVILDGTTSVPTQNAFVIIHRMKVLTKGATSINVGTITATAQVDGTITARIEPGQGQTQMAIFGVPSNQDAYMTNFSATGKKAGGATKSIDVEFLLNPTPKTELLNFIIKETGGVTSSGGQQFVHNFLPYSKVEGPAIIKMRALSDTNDSEIAGGFDLILVDK